MRLSRQNQCGPLSNGGLCLGARCGAVCMLAATSMQICYYLLYCHEGLSLWERFVLAPMATFGSDLDETAS